FRRRTLASWCRAPAHRETSWIAGGKVVESVDDSRGRPWISRLLASSVDRMFLLVPRGLLKGPGLRFHQGHRSPGAQPEIASKAVQEEIEDRLHGQAAEHRCSGRARRQVARDISFSWHFPDFIHT